MNILNTIIQKPNINLYQNKLQSKQEAERKVFEPIATTSLLRPDRPQNSYIINDPFYMAPINFVADIKENIINIAKATTGKSNDHDLGRINDFSMKAGALALAGYLFTHGKTSLSKSMEFVGFGSFFAAMALWPKLFIQAPLKAMYGIDIHQRYMDNEGRKKMFFQDPQYIPWDLYTDEQLAELGDKLGVPRDIHNRNEVIKKKAHKIALQGNTLWMLTAGFATPLMSALMCNGIEKIVTPRSERSTFPNNIFGATAASIEKMRIDSADKTMSRLEQTITRKLTELDSTELNAYLSGLEDKELTDGVLNKLLKKLHIGTDVLNHKFVEKQINDLLPITQNEAKADTEYLEVFWNKYVSHKFKNQRLQQGWSQLLTMDKLTELATENGSPISIQKFTEKVAQYINSNCTNPALYDHYRHGLSQVTSEIKIQPKRIITPEFIQDVLRLDRKLYEHSLRQNALDDYIRLYMGEVGDSIATNRWQNVQKAFFEVLGYSKSELKIAKESGTTALQLLQSKVEQLVSDDEKYETAIRKIQRAILDYDSLFLPDNEAGVAQGVKARCYELINDLTQKSATMYENAGFYKMKERIVGSDVTDIGSLRANLIDRVNRRVEELRNGLYKILYTLDFFKRADVVGTEGIKKCKFVDAFRNFDMSRYSSVDYTYSERELLAEIQNLKNILLDATIAEHTTKLDYKNRGLYVRAMSLMYSTDLDDVTQKALGFTSSDAHILGETTFEKSLKQKIRDVFYNLTNAVYPHDSSLVLITKDEADQQKIVFQNVEDALTRDSLLAKRISHAVRESASEAYNSSKWLGKFGTMSIVLVGATLLSQVFFGKLNKQDLQYVRKGNN